jgi:hypothetical protein
MPGTAIKALVDAAVTRDHGQVRLLVIFGPPAVGKMAVAAEVARRSEFRLFHNHATIEPLLDVFDFGTPAFDTLLREFRFRVVEEAAASGTDVVATLVWALENAEDAAGIEQWMAPYVDAGAEVAFVELYADLETRLERNRSELRLATKKSKRDIEWSDGNVRESEEHVMNTSSGRPTPRRRGAGSASSSTAGQHAGASRSGRRADSHLARRLTARSGLRGSEVR